MSTTNYPTFEASDADSEGPMYCPKHPTVETYLRCGKCGRPICAKCRVSTPVGFRCYECANLQVLPTYAISTDYYVKAATAGLVAASAVGVLMGLFPVFEFWVALLMGIVVPEAVTGAANQKRGPGLQMIGMAAVVVGFIVSRVFAQAVPFHIPLEISVKVAERVLTFDINHFSYSSIPVVGGEPFYISQYTILWLALALFLANRRLG